MNISIFKAAVAALGLSLLAGTASAAIDVKVQPSATTVPKAYSLAGEQRTYFGNVQGGANYECRWTFSDGTAQTAWAAPANTRYITVDHTFTTASPGHWLQLSCRDSTAPTDTDSETIQVYTVGADSANRRKNSEIDNALRYAYQAQRVGSSYAGCFEGSSYGNYSVNTGMALLALEQHGHNLDSPDGDIYKQPVIDGLQCLFDNYANVRTVSNQSGCIGDPEFEADTDGDGIGDDGDHDSKGIYFQSTNQYWTPFSLMAIVNSGSKATGQSTMVTAPAGGGDFETANTAVQGMSLWDIAVDTKDYLMYSMSDYSQCLSGRGNGWRYSERNNNSGDVDNSVNQWPVLSLLEAQKQWDIESNPVAKQTQFVWVQYSQAADGSCGYTSSSNYNNVAKTAACLIALEWVKGQVDATAWANVKSAAEAYLNSQYSDTTPSGTWYGHWDHAYAMYAFYKAMKLSGTTSFFGHDWEQEYSDFIVDYTGGTTGSSAPAGFDNAKWSAGRKATYFDFYFGSYYDDDFDTYTGLAMLAPEVGGLPPVAEAGANQNVTPSQSVSLDGSASFHQDASKNLIRYEWDFDASNGLWWDTLASPPAGEGAIGVTASTAYPDMGSPASYVVSLRVTDDGNTPSNPDPVQTDIDTMTVNVSTNQVPPVAQTDGPWVGIPGVAVTFDGSSSFDPNPGDTITSYEWDIDGDGLTNEGNGDDGAPVGPVGAEWSIVEKTFPAPFSGNVSLTVTDNHGASDTAVNQILSVAIVYATNYANCWSDPQNRFVWRYGMEVTFQNVGNALAQNVVITATSVPTNRTLISDTSVLGDMAAAASATTACDAGALTADIVTDVNRRVAPTGSWTWQAEFDFNGSHYIIPNLPPLGP